MNVAVQERSPVSEPLEVVPEDGLGRLLDELERFVASLPAELYQAVPPGGALTIGQHVARCLYLIDTLLSASTGVIVYERSDRDPTLDLDPAAAARKARSLRERAATWPGELTDDAIRVDRITGPAGELESAWSTLEKEQAFVVNHIITRQKTIASVMSCFGFAPPAGFGSTEPPPLRARSPQPPSWALRRLLDDLGSLLGGVAPEIYCARLSTGVSGSIGEHVRHCLDHVSALFTADSSGPLSYDRRERGTAVETSPAAAVQRILRLKRALWAWSARPLNEPLRVISMISESGDAVTAWSTRARELTFVVSHTIHHHAMIAMLLSLHGHAIPKRFGYAPSTPSR